MKEKIDLAIKNGDIIFLGGKLPDDWYEGFITWNLMAENENKPEAYYNIAYCYLNGEGTKQDLNKAIDCYEKSAYLGLNESFVTMYRVKSKFDYFKNINDYINYIEDLKEKKYLSEKNVVDYFNLEMERLVNQRAIIKLNDTPSKDLIKAAKETRDQKNSFLLDPLIATEHLSIQVNVTNNVHKELKYTGTTTNGNSNSITLKKNNVTYEVVMKNDSKEFIDLILKTRFHNYKDIKNVIDNGNGNVLGLESRVTNVLLPPKSEEKVVFISDMPPNENVDIPLYYNAKKKFTGMFGPSEYKGRINYEISLSPKIETLRKVSSSDFKKYMYIAIFIIVIIYLST